MNKAKYKQVEDYIISQIESGQLKAGEQIMTEEQLCKQFSFSRMTVNKALQNLIQQGYIRRIPGKGSFVKPPMIRQDTADVSSFTDDLKRIGLTAGARLLLYNVVEAHTVPEIQEKLQLSDSDLVHFFIRLRTGNGMPIAISYTYVSAAVVQAIDVSRLTSSFYSYLDELGVMRIAKDIQLSARMPDEEQKKLLEIENTALLKAATLTYTTKDDRVIPFEYNENYYNGDIYTYTFH